MKKLCVILFVLSGTLIINAQIFTDIETGLSGVYYGQVDWGDFDNDGYLDIAVTGNTGSGRISNIYRNNGDDTFSISAEMRKFDKSSIAWGDYNNDGFLDLILIGEEWPSMRYTELLRNDSGEFTSVTNGLPGISNGSVEWGDYDNDGLPDILVTGHITGGGAPGGVTRISRIYRNNGDGTFTDIKAGLPSVDFGFALWGDFDNDGYLDVLIAQYSGRLSRIYKNNGDDTFTDIEAGLPGVDCGSAALGDFDNDGYLDILLTGWTGSERISRIYRNNGDRTFTDIEAGLPGVAYGSVSWGDYNNDGFLDVLITGSTDSERISRIYKNNGDGTFTDIEAGLLGVMHSSASWSDYDNDGRSDILLSGYDNSGQVVTKIYRNNTETANSVPSVPENLTFQIEGDRVTLSWDKSLDNETPQEGLSYNIYIGTQPGIGDIVGPMSDISAGVRRIVKTGNAGQTNTWSTNRLPEGTYYWSVQALDNNYAGSAFSDEQVLNVPSVPPPSSPVAKEATNKTVSSFVANWESTDNSKYRIDVAKDIDFVNILPDYDDLDVYNALTYTILGLESGTYYYYRIRAYNVHGTSENSNVITAKTPLAAPASLEATNISEDSFTANWNHSTGATGYRIDVAEDIDFVNPLPDYDDLDVGEALHLNISGLVSGHTYYYRIRCYTDGEISGNSKIISVSLLFLPLIDTGLIGITGSVAWGDYNNDGYLDVLLAGYTGSEYVTQIYKNNGDGTFTDIEAGLPGVSSRAVAWGDFDNDGHLDILLTGYYGSERISRIYRNNGDGTFTDIEAGLLGVASGAVAWGDYNNDGFLDILLTGYSDAYIISKIYRNNSDGTFTDIEAGLQGVWYGAVVWGDYNNDGYLDILMSGSKGVGEFSGIYRNNGDGTFTNINAGLQEVEYSSVAWGDYNNDGHLDLILSGGYNPGGMDYFYTTRIYRNNGNGTFTDINADLPGVYLGSTVWGDYNNDGYSDILLSGHTGSEWISMIYKNNGDGTFTDIEVKLQMGGSLVWGDYDNDGRLDFLLAGYTGSESITRIYRNNGVKSNSVPSVPQNLSGQIEGVRAVFRWDKVSDAETPQEGLSYNLYVGSQPGISDIVGPMSDINTGYRKIVQVGNAGQINSRAINNLPDGTYYWSVQTVDNCFAGSAFAPEQTFTITGIEDETLPIVTELYQNYPNPFNPTTAIRYALSHDADVKLTVFDITGREVAELVSGRQAKGNYSVNFNAENLTSGIYFYRLSVDGKAFQSRKMMILK